MVTPVLRQDLLIELNHLAKRLAATLALASITAIPAQAELTAWLDPERIEEGENTELTIRISDSQSLPDIDLSALERDFNVVGNRTNSQLRSINGRVEASAVRVVTLRPKRTGSLVVPRLQVGSERTPALTLRVDALGASVRAAINDTLFFDVRVLETEPFVQSQITYIRKLYYAEGTQLYGDLPATPAIDDALVIDLPEVSPYRESRDGRSYGVLEQRFAIFAERAGELTVPGQSVTGSVVVTENGRTRRRGVQVSAPAVTVEVRGVPASYPSDAPWLAATDVRLLDQWDSDVISVGTPVRRTLTLTATGATSSLLPEVDVPAGDLDARIYPEPADLNERVNGSTVVGSRVEARSIVPGRSGRAEMPAVSVVWFDTVSEQVRTATVPARRLFIAPDPLAGPQADATEQATRAEETPERDSPALSSRRDGFWIWATLLALLGWAVTTALLIRRRPAARAARGDSVSRNRDGANAARRRLERAARGGDLGEIQTALNHWLTEHYQCGLATAKRRFIGNVDRREALEALGAALYRAGAKSGSNPTIGRQVWDAAMSAERAESTVSDPLPPLQARV